MEKVETSYTLNERFLKRCCKKFEIKFSKSFFLAFSDKVNSDFLKSVDRCKSNKRKTLLEQDV
jgi:histone H3/H4